MKGHALLFQTMRPPVQLDKTTSDSMLELGINIDHVATVREARKTYEPI